MKCQINNCENNALVYYGTRWLCGKCLVKIQEIENKKYEELYKEVEDGK